MTSAATAPGRRFRFFGFVLWVLPLVAVGVMVALAPVKRSVTPVFHLAAERWWAGGELYADVRGYHYLPQFALLFAPFHALPLPVGDILWRTISVALVLWGIAALVRLVLPADTGRAFFYACLLALAPCLGAVRNGQTNLAFGGLCLLLACFLAQSRWKAAATCLVALVAVKPLGLVLLLLAPWVYRPLIRPVAIGLAALALLPFLFASPQYAAAQYRAAVEHFAGWSGTTEHRFADLTALLRTAGMPLAGTASLLLRALAALATFGLWLGAASRIREPWRALTLVLLSTIYLMLFNPMTEKNSYAIVAPAFAVSAVACLADKKARRFGWLLVVAVVSIGTFPELFWRLDKGLGLWWDPLIVTVVGAVLALSIATGKPVLPAAEGG
jgi:alpha-1,2-mannosyltransferase